MEQYNRVAAVEYAEQWWNNRNPKYFDYGKFGGDCTNFVSQCLLSGGMKPVNGLFGWHYIGANNHSASWTGVEFLYDFLMKHNRAKVVDFDNLAVGDIVQLAFNNLSFSHTLLVVEIGLNGEIFVSAHDNDAFSRPLSTYSYSAVRGLHII
jgi:hypothetical protein